MEEPVWTAAAAGQVDNTLSPAPSALFDGTPDGGGTTQVAAPAFAAGGDSTCRYGVFDGADDRVAIGAADFGLTDEVTVMAWVRWDVAPGSGNQAAVVFQNSTVADNDDIQFSIHHSNNNRRFEFHLASQTDELDFTLAADDFDVLGPLNDFGGINAGPGGLAGCTSGAIDCLVVFNTGNPAGCDAALAPNRTNAYCGDNMAGVVNADTAARTMRFDRSDQAPLSPFPFRSPGQRFHIVDTPVSFVCDTGANTLMRYAGYPITAALFTPPGGTGNLLADRIVGCNFRYDPGSATRAGLVTLSITLADDDAPGERITLLQQIHVPNAP